jgi:hypothetical protein
VAPAGLAVMPAAAAATVATAAAQAASAAAIPVGRATVQATSGSTNVAANLNPGRQAYLAALTKKASGTGEPPSTAVTPGDGRQDTLQLLSGLCCPGSVFCVAD